MKVQETNKLRAGLVFMVIVGFLLVPVLAYASSYALVAIRGDWWYRNYEQTRYYDTYYTQSGYFMGSPSSGAYTSAQTSGGVALCPRTSSQSYYCTSSWGTGPAGDGTTWSGMLTASFNKSASGSSVFIPSYAVSSRLSSTVVVASTAHLQGYPQATRYYNYFNNPGYFYKSNSYAPTTTTTVLGPTTGTRGGGNYAFSRGGEIKVTPGANRFGGTMRFYFAPGTYFYKGQAALSPGYADYKWNAVRTRTNNGNVPTRNAHGYAYSDPQVGPSGGLGQTYTYGSTQQTHTYLLTSQGGPLKYQFWAYSTVVPWTTGKVEMEQSLGSYQTTLTATGYDTRTPSGFSGKLSLVQPTSYHNYRTAAGDPPTSPFHNIYLRQVVITFLPEPGAALLLGVGLVGMGGVYQLRRKR